MISANVLILSTALADASQPRSGDQKSVAHRQHAERRRSDRAAGASSVGWNRHGRGACTRCGYCSCSRGTLGICSLHTESGQTLQGALMIF